MSIHNMRNAIILRHTIIHAASTGQLIVFKYLLQQTNTLDNMLRSKSIIDHATHSGHINIIKYYIEYRAKCKIPLNIRPIINASFQEASANGNIDIIQYVISLLGKLTSSDLYMIETARQCADTNKKYNVWSYLGNVVHDYYNE